MEGGVNEFLRTELGVKDDGRRLLVMPRSTSLHRKCLTAENGLELL